MENLFTRLKNTILADLNNALDNKERQNPIALLNQYLRQCEVETDKVKQLLERQYSLKDEFTREYNQAVEMAEKRKHQVEVAAKAGEVELQQFALHEEQQYRARAARLESLLQEVRNQLNELEQKYEEMKHKLKDMHIRRMELMGRENISRAHHRINQVVENNTYANKEYSRFHEIEAYLDRLENKVNYDYNYNTIDSKIAKLEKEMKNEEFLAK